jgi:hypothetical protein
VRPLRVAGGAERRRPATTSGGPRPVPVRSPRTVALVKEERMFRRGGVPNIGSPEEALVLFLILVVVGVVLYWKFVD